MRAILRVVYYFFYFRYFYLLEWLYPSKIKDPKQIPIIINNFNRLSYLTQMIESLEERGYFNIYIIDNASTYPPLLAYYDTCKYTVFRLKKNVGYLALWKSSVFKKFRNDYYVYSDADVVPVKECPEDFMHLFLDSLKKRPFARKVGFSLRIDNLPDHFVNKQEVINWEKKYFTKPISDNLFRAPLDTTFALYRPRVKGGSNAYIPMYRTAFPYQAEHLPWYVDSTRLSDEDQYYISTARTSTMWTQVMQQGK